MQVSRGGQATEQRRTELHALTGIRAVAAAWVALFHFRTEAIALLPDLKEPIAVVSRVGWLGVDLFFVLSGFIISYTYLERSRSWRIADYARFLWKRLARVYPVHLVCLLALLATVVLGFRPHHPRDYSLGAFFEQALLIHAWTTPLRKSWNVVSWSVSSEWLAYVAFPLFAFVVSRSRSLAYQLLLLLGTYGLFVLAVRGFDYRGTMSYGTIRLIGCFGIGAVVHQIWSVDRVRTLPIWPVVTLFSLSAVLIGTGFSDGKLRHVLPWSVPAMALLILSLASDRHVATRLLGNTALCYLGRVSYAFYLVHGVAVLHLRDLKPYKLFLGQGMAWGVLGAILYLAAMLLPAMAVYHWVEKPARKRMVEMKWAQID